MMDQDNKTVLLKLSPFDSNAEAVSICQSYVLDTTSSPLDLDKINEAVGRAARKWRVLAGRLERIEEEKIWAIRVPTGELSLSYVTHKFTSNASTSSAGFVVPNFTPSSAEYVTLPPLTSFRDSKTTTGNKSFVDAPVLSVHISVYSDCTFLGIEYPHGVFDGQGFGDIVLNAIDAELHGRDWTAPPLQQSNQVTEYLNKVTFPPDFVPLQRNYFIPLSTKAFAFFVTDLLYETFWHGLEYGCVYLGEEIVKKMVDRVKVEAKEETRGKEWVSTGDVVNAWFIKAAYLNETKSTNNLEIFTAWDARPSLASSSGESFSSYPHNLVCLAELPPIPLSSLSTTKLSTLALKFRSVLSQRTIENVKVSHDPAAASLFPSRRWGADGWSISNQSSARFDRIDWGVKAKLMVGLPAPRNLDHNIYINKLDGGYLITGLVRKRRWAAVRSELDRIKSGEDLRVK